MIKVFISYCRDDKKFVDEHVRPILKVLNIQAWIDTESLHGSERWKEAIERALPECDYFLLIASTAAAASPAVRGEAEWILRHRPERLIPILASRVRFDGIHPELPSIQHVDCVDKAPKQSATLLGRALFHFLDRRGKTLDEQKRQLAAEVERKQEQLEEANRALEALTKEHERDVKALSRQLGDASVFDGGWLQAARGSAAPFVPRAERNAAIITVMNLKGGVGKSTIAANLAATWWGRAEQPKRVLLVDLDFQQSVTSLCISHKDLKDLNDADLLVNALFDERVPASDHFKRSIRRVGRGDGYVLASNEKLTKMETLALARWLTGQASKDVRYLLRELLHGPVVQEKFDLVIIDCPPRLHTASVNALAASDFLLIPVLLDLVSAESAPRLLKWVQTYQAGGLCLHLEILGVIANKKSDRRNELLAREEKIWGELPAKCRVAWGGEVPFCETVLPNSAAIAECTQTPGRFACEDARLRPLFRQLSEELERQMDPVTELVP